MTSVTEFFAMGGYGAYVWPCFAVVAAVMVALAVMSLRRLRTAEQALAKIDTRAKSGRARGASGEAGSS